MSAQYIPGYYPLQSRLTRFSGQQLTGYSHIDMSRNADSRWACDYVMHVVTASAFIQSVICWFVLWALQSSPHRAYNHKFMYTGEFLMSFFELINCLPFAATFGAENHAYLHLGLISSLTAPIWFLNRTHSFRTTQNRTQFAAFVRPFVRMEFDT